MKILVASEESQRVANAFRALGHEAYSCDIVPPSGGHPQYHIQDDAREVAYRGDWDMLIGFPPCTYLSKVSAPRLFPKGVLNEERYQKGVEARQFFEDLYTAPIHYIALENPTPLKLFNLPQPTQVIQPYMFGEPYTKRTLLWLKNLPPLQPTNEVKPIGSWVALNRKKSERSKTFMGIANAMAQQWSTLPVPLNNQSSISTFLHQQLRRRLQQKKRD